MFDFSSGLRYTALCSKIPDARFILGGSGEIEKVKQKLSAKYKDNVEFPGWIVNLIMRNN